MLMFKIIFPLIVIFLISFPSIFAVEETPNVILTLVDAISKEPLGDVFVNLKLNGEVSHYFLEKEENLKVHLPEGEYQAQFLVNNPLTKGYDYYGEMHFSMRENLIDGVYLYPVGSLTGFVKDKLNNVIQYADLQFECNNIFNQQFPVEADKFGSFSLDYVPIGHCKVYGGTGGFMGVEEIEIKHGEQVTMEIVLDQVLVSSKRPAFFRLTGLVILSLLVFVMVIFYVRKKRSTIPKGEVKEAAEKATISASGLGRRGQDLYQTLSANEKRIVDFLLAEGEPVHLSKIHYKTGISKGALFRNLRSLEYKKIVETKREGRVRKVVLSPWFREE